MPYPRKLAEISEILLRDQPTFYQNDLAMSNIITNYSITNEIVDLSPE
jgi:hypothetical protein